jgi:hypothetical protein
MRKVAAIAKRALAVLLPLQAQTRLVVGGPAIQPISQQTADMMHAGIQSTDLPVLLAVSTFSCKVHGRDIVLGRREGTVLDLQPGHFRRGRRVIRAARWHGRCHCLHIITPHQHASSLPQHPRCQRLEPVKKGATDPWGQRGPRRWTQREEDAGANTCCGGDAVCDAAEGSGLCCSPRFASDVIQRWSTRSCSSIRDILDKSGEVLGPTAFSCPAGVSRRG